jgi:hypothetical protein
MADDPLLTADAAAARAGIALMTWRAYISRGHPRGNPAPRHDQYDPTTGEQLWRTSTVDAWIARRPGPGTRTDRQAD